jgi:hypothetical protein
VLMQFGSHQPIRVRGEEVAMGGTTEHLPSTLTPTEIQGVFTKKILPSVTLEAAKVGALFSPDLQAHLFEIETPAAQAFRDQVLLRQLNLQDVITPVLKPVIGVTHTLTPVKQVADAAFTSINWSGGTIRGTWNAAFGIWRIPWVSRPSTPPGTSGGWNSSSWVGIDGTYGSNDVLQAGVQQQVSSSGDPSYVAWYEWFAPAQPNSPAYIFQTNIENMPVSPGDDFFAAVYYVNGRGEVICGNITQGKYFSIVLDAPPGATFSGNSAEWIMEAPNSGEPSTSLPSFSPVIFTSAFSAAQTGSGDPVNGDSTNIQVSGRNLTAVVLREMALEIDYEGEGFFQIHPETFFDRTRQQVAVVSRTSNNLDLFVIGFDNAIWTTFWTAEGGWNPGGWFQIHPETVFDHTTQKLAVVSRSPNNLDLFVIGFDNAVWTTFWTAEGGWNPGGWFQIHPETVFDHTAQKLAAVSRSPNNLDLFVIGFDNAVWTTFWNSAVGWNPGGWFQLHPETVFDHTAQELAVVSRTPDNLDLFVIGFDNAVWTNFWNSAAGWNPGGWFQLHPETVFDHTKQRLAAVSRAPNNLDLFVIGFDNAAWTTFWNSTVGWNPGGWFQLHPETVFDHTAQQLSVVSRTPDNLDLFVIGFDNVSWSTFWNAAAGWNPGGWFQIDPLTFFDHSTQKLAAVSRTPKNLDLFVVGFDNVVWTDFWNADFGGWH